MTRKEAILTLKVVEEYFDKNVPVLGGEAMRMAIDALRTQQSTTKLDRSQWEGCWSCNNLKVRELGLRHGREYCPGCGKPLTGKAWAELERRIGGCNGTTDR